MGDESERVWTLARTVPQTFRISFQHEGETIGELRYDPDEDCMTFRGNADDSAALFFRWVEGHMRAWLEDRKKVTQHE